MPGKTYKLREAKRESIFFYMITILADCEAEITQELYDRIINMVPIEKLKCPICKNSNCLEKYGSYIRYIKKPYTTSELRIQRLHCKSCTLKQHTHSLMLSSIIPYSQFSLKEQVEIIKCYECKGEYNEITLRNPQIDMTYILHMLPKYYNCWKEIISKNRIPLEPLEVLVEKCFSLYSRQFLQMHSTPNIFFMIPA